MTHHQTQATVSPLLPATLFSEQELDQLVTACGLSCELHDDRLYFFAEECFREEGELEDDSPFELLPFLQAKLRRLDPADYPRITIHGASTCGKMRPDEFGGFAHVVERDAIRSLSTWHWLARQTGEWVVPADPARPSDRSDRERKIDACQPPAGHTVTIEVRGGVVQEVSGIPPGWDYSIVDHDDLASEIR